MITIDKSRFESPEELALYESLVAKAKVDPEADTKPVEKGNPTTNPTQEVTPMVDTQKSASAALAAVQQELAEFKKSVEMNQFAEIAKKYAPLGKKEDELATTLYNMKKSDEASYNAFVGILDEHLALVEKSGMFAEIGKSAGNAPTVGGAQAKAEAKAQEIMKSDNCDWNTAIAKAWEDPALMAEYDAEYQR